MGDLLPNSCPDLVEDRLGVQPNPIAAFVEIYDEQHQKQNCRAILQV